MSESKEPIDVLKNASEALSHASYCAITGSRINHGEITKAWDALRALISKIAPDNAFLEPTDRKWVKPELKIVATEDDFSWPKGIEPRTIYERPEDMSPDGLLRVIIEDDGDAIISIVPSKEHRIMPSVQFCTYAGGGRSARVRMAILHLAKAIADDNAERPIEKPKRSKRE